MESFKKTLFSKAWYCRRSQLIIFTANPPSFLSQLNLLKIITCLRLHISCWYFRRSRSIIFGAFPRECVLRFNTFCLPTKKLLAFHFRVVVGGSQGESSWRLLLFLLLLLLIHHLYHLAIVLCRRQKKKRRKSVVLDCYLVATTAFHVAFLAEGGRRSAGAELSCN